MPAGGPDKQAAFLEQLMKQRPQDAESAAKMCAAAGNILAGKANDQQLDLAVQVTASLGNDADELARLEAKLKKQGHAKQARTLHSRLLAVKLQAVAGDRDGFRKQLEEVKSYLAKGPLAPADAQLATTAGQIAEQSGDDKLAAETYESLAKLLAADPQTARAAKGMQGLVRRLKLVGNPMQVEGTRLDGKPLQWEKYRGKVVLIDFWATWCGPCMAEIVNIKANYEKYHAKGFDVLGISLDQMDRDQLADFVKKEAVPWTICRDADSASPLADYYGIHSIPQLMLVGRDGKVVSLNAARRGAWPFGRKSLGGGRRPGCRRRDGKRRFGRGESWKERRGGQIRSPEGQACRPGRGESKTRRSRGGPRRQRRQAAPMDRCHGKPPHFRHVPRHG